MPLPTCAVTLPNCVTLPTAVTPPTFVTLPDFLWQDRLAPIIRIVIYTHDAFILPEHPLCCTPAARFWGRAAQANSTNCEAPVMRTDGRHRNALVRILRLLNMFFSKCLWYLLQSRQIPAVSQVPNDHGLSLLLPHVSWVVRSHLQPSYMATNVRSNAEKQLPNPLETLEDWGRDVCAECTLIWRFPVHRSISRLNVTSVADQTHTIRFLWCFFHFPNTWLNGINEVWGGLRAVKTALKPS